ncbi:MAG: RHS repeat-associated core domain-containing protein [Gammaproteobacteria bacterium]
MRNGVKGTSTNSKFLIVLFWILLIFGCGVPVAEAFHFPWDQSHDTTDWNDPPDPGPCEGASCDPCKSTGSPVYIPTGHFIWSDTDVTLGGRPPINLTRSYNSNDPRDGIFGNGWSSNCEPKLNKLVDAEGVISYSLRISNGKRYEYIEQSDGSIVSPPGRFDSLQKTTQGDLRLVSPNGAFQAFNSSGQLIEWSDANGNTLTYQYNPVGSIASISSGTRSLQFIYDAKGHVASLQDHAGRHWDYGYDANNNLISVTDPLGGSRKYEYLPYKGVGDGFTYYQLTKVTDESGVVTTKVTYNGNRVASYTEGANTYVYSYNTSTRTVTKTDSMARVRKYVYNADQVIIQETDPLNKIEKYEYDANGKLTRFTDKLNNFWDSTYDDQGRKLSVTTPLGRITTLQYQGNESIPHKIITPLGRISTIDFDSKFNPIAVTDAKGNQQTLAYDAQGNLITSTDAKGSQTTFAYNAFGLLTEKTDAQGNTLSFAYDALARRISSTDAEGRTTTYQYDNLNRLIETINALGHRTTYSYDASGRLLTLTDPVGNVTQYAYDSFGRLSKETRPDGTFSIYLYNAANLLTQVDRYDGKTVTYTYDAAERLITSNAEGLVNQYAYNARGELTEISNSVATISYTYNKDGELTTENQAGVVIGRGYDSDGALTQLSALGLTYSYQRDELNLVTALDDGSNSINFSYDANNVVTAIGLPNGLNEAYGYDAVYNLVQIKTGPHTLDYGVDKTGLITQKTFNGARTDYLYDPITRLTQAGSQSYNYDDIGNNTDNGAVYEPATNRLVENTQQTFSFDSAGNLIQKARKDGSETKSYTYNTRNQLTKVETLDLNGQIVGTLEFDYDPHGRRYTKTVNGIVQKYVYDGPDIIAILDGNGQIEATLTHSEISADTPLSITADGNSYYYHRDHQGSIVALTDIGGGVVESYGYDAYGSTHKQSTVNTRNPYAYTGREKDDDDLYYYRARYYDPTIQRFISEDPIGLEGGINLYQYVDSNPVNLTDPSGECPWCVPAAIAYGRCVASCMAVAAATEAIAGDIKCFDIAGNAKDCALDCLNPFNWGGKSAFKKGVIGKNAGRTGKQKRLRDLAKDDKVSSADRGWIKQEMNAIERGDRKNIRNPPGKDMSHERGREAAKGYDYEYSNLQDRDLHKIQHKYDNFGRKNKERPPQ